MDRKVGICTVYTGYNYGSALQAYAVRELLNQLGYSGEILKLTGSMVPGRDIRLKKLICLGGRMVMHLPQIRKTVRSYTGNHHKVISQDTRQKFKTFYTHQIKPVLVSELKLKALAKNETYLAFLCGSDQIWNASTLYPDPFYYLTFAPKEKRISFAPSFGRDFIPAYNLRKIQKNLRDMSSLSVRENSGARLIYELTGRKAQVLPDPTLILDRISWQSLLHLVPVQREHPYVLAYFLDEPSKMAQQALQQLKARGYQILALPYERQESWFDICVSAGPKEFLEFLMGAAYVCTDSFHGTAFAVHFEKNFTTFQREYGSADDQSSRICCFLDQMDLSDRYNCRDTIGKPIDFSSGKRVLEKERICSKRYLMDALKQAEAYHSKEAVCLSDREQENAPTPENKRPDDRETKADFPLISVIVPVFNGAKYLEKCLRSIMDQTYRNLEILVIDDGSVDETGPIADCIASQDTRIRVIHKKNQGVSGARNDGIENTTGEYVVFVDGDDYIAPDFISYMLSLTEQTGGDFCLSRSCFTRDEEPQTTNFYVKALSPEDATALLLCPDMLVGCWNKIFSRKLIESHHLRFSTDLFYGEGLAFIIAAAQASESVGIGNRKVYYYRRNNRESATARFRMEKLYNGEQALQNVQNCLTKSNEETQTMLCLHRCMFCLGGVVRLHENHICRQYSMDYHRWMSYVRCHVPDLLWRKNISWYRKLLLLAGCISPELLAGLDRVRRRKISGSSVK